jgi:hypothetical protein
MKNWIYITLLLSLSSSLFASEARLTAFRRIAVFPVASEELNEKLKSGLWWSFREHISSNLQFVVASKQFLEAKEVYQERSEISTADVILLSKHLEADVLMTLSYSDRSLKLRTYNAADGLPLKHFSEKLQSNYSAEKQINNIAAKLFDKWVASLPYQAVITEKSANEIKVNLGKLQEPSLLQEAQIIQIKRKNLGELNENYYSQELRKLSFISLDKNIATYKLLPAETALARKESQLVRIPELEKSLRKNHLGSSSSLDTEQLLPELRASGKKEEENQGISTKVFALINLIIIVALSL